MEEAIMNTTLDALDQLDPKKFIIIPPKLFYTIDDNRSLSDCKINAYLFVTKKINSRTKFI